MRTRFAALIILFLGLAGCACAQGKWDSFRYDQWGFVIQLPTGAAKQDAPNLPENAVCDIYSTGKLACVIQVTATPDSAVASTVIEQEIQSEVKKQSKLGAAQRWEQTSRHGDLFKGFTGPIALGTGDAAMQAAERVIGAPRGCQCAAMTPLGDESAPVLKVTVFGPAGRESEVVAMAKGIASRVTTGTNPVAETPIPKPTPTPEPAPESKPWPTLKNGEIELLGTVQTVSRDGKTVTMTVESIKMPGQDVIGLSPKRTKKVILHQKLDKLVNGVHIHLIGRNDGVGKPITADVIETTPKTEQTPRTPEPKPFRPRPMPLT